MNKNNYGYYFNNIEIIDNYIKKTGKNDYGKQKIQDEINFYKFINENNIQFPVPNIIAIDDDNSTFTMEYLQQHTVATKLTNDNRRIQSILQYLHKLHSYSIVPVSKETYISQLLIETRKKIIDRYNCTNWKDIFEISNITHVNGIVIHNIEYYIEKINHKILTIIDSFNEYNFTIIHGDPHLGNILILENDIRFIDPRGYFGNMKLYGIKEYDSAKLLFGLTGYSKFDEISFENIEINNGNVEINFIDKYLYFYDSDLFSNYEKLLSLTIWLGNNSMFESPYKKLYSLLISYYICEKYIVNTI